MIKYLKFLSAVLITVLICCTILPRIAGISCFQVVRNNMAGDIDATAYFYTEVEDFARFERAVIEE